MAKANRYSKSEFEEIVKKEEETTKRKKERRKTGRDPSIKDIRKHLEKIIKFHKKQVNDMIPSIYPILGPVNIDDGDGPGGSEERGGLKMKNTKGEFHRYNA